MKKNRINNRLIQLFWIFFKAGTFTFSGGLAMLPLIQKDVIDKYDMLDKETFQEYAALSQTLPGVTALNCGVFVAKKVAGVKGAIVAGIGTIVPAFVGMYAVAALLDLVPRTGVVQSVFAGVRSASAALILYSAISLAGKQLKKLFPIILLIVAFVTVLFFNANALMVIIGAALAGFSYKYVSGYVAGRKAVKDEGAGAGEAAGGDAGSVVDEVAGADAGTSGESGDEDTGGESGDVDTGTDGEGGGGESI